MRSAADAPVSAKAEGPSEPADSENRGADAFEQNSDEDGEDDEEAPLPPRKPFTRTMQKLEKEAPQKWVQCAKCNKWRRVRIVLLTLHFCIKLAPFRA